MIMITDVAVRCWNSQGEIEQLAQVLGVVVRVFLDDPRHITMNSCTSSTNEVKYHSRHAERYHFYVRSE
jgi:hypothetical protein